MMELAIKKDGVIYLKTRIPKATKHECDECDYGNKYGRKNNCDNYTLDGCKASFHYKIKKENSMKKSELRFKCVLPNKNAGMCIRLALKNIGLIKNAEDDYAHYHFFAYDRGIVATTNADFFCLRPEPLISYEEALKLIESVEPDAPEFDIKLLQPVLIRNGGADSFWNLAFFAAVKSNGIFTNEGHCLEMIKLTGNESFMLERTTPPGWWECENGKPVWKTK